MSAQPCESRVEGQSEPVSLGMRKTDRSKFFLTLAYLAKTIDWIKIISDKEKLFSYFHNSSSFYWKVQAFQCPQLSERLTLTSPLNHSSTLFFFFPRKPIKFYVSGRSQNEFIFFFSLTSELKSQLFTQLHIKMAWNCLIVHVVSYLLCDLITTLLILALSLALTVFEFCSKSNRRLLQEDVLPSHTSEMGRGEGQLSVHQWYISGTGLIPLHIHYKGCPVIA